MKFLILLHCVTGYDCCSKREKSSALAALIGCLSLATLMTSLVTDLWLDTDEAIPAIDSGQVQTSPDLPNVQPRHEEGSGHGRVHDSVRRVHFAVGLWTVCPSHAEDGYNQLKGKNSILLLQLSLFALRKVHGTNLDNYGSRVVFHIIIWYILLLINV